MLSVLSHRQKVDYIDQFFHQMVQIDKTLNNSCIFNKYMKTSAFINKISIIKEEYGTN